MLRGLLGLLDLLAHLARLVPLGLMPQGLQDPAVRVAPQGLRVLRELMLRDPQVPADQVAQAVLQG